MKKLVIAAGLLAIGATAASADPWNKGHHPYAEKHHSVCQDKAHRLHGFEMRAKSDGHMDRREREIMRTPSSAISTAPAAAIAGTANPARSFCPIRAAREPPRARCRFCGRSAAWLASHPTYPRSRSRSSK